jgi:hypothetical protein
VKQLHSTQLAEWSKTCRKRKLDLAQGWDYIYRKIWPEDKGAAPAFNPSKKDLLTTGRPFAPSRKQSMLNMASRRGIFLSETELDRFHIVQDIVHRDMEYNGGALGTGQEPPATQANLDIQEHPLHTSMLCNDAPSIVQQQLTTEAVFVNDNLTHPPSIFPPSHEANFPPPSLSDLPSAFLSSPGFDNNNSAYSASVSLAPLGASSPPPDFTLSYLYDFPSTFSHAPELDLADSEYDDLYDL